MVKRYKGEIPSAKGTVVAFISFPLSLFLLINLLPIIFRLFDPNPPYSISPSSPVDICECLSKPSLADDPRCEKIINDHLGFNLSTTNFRYAPKWKEDKWQRLKRECGFNF